MSSRWSYQVVELKPGMWGGFKSEDMQAELNRMGALGWELVTLLATVSPPLMVFKREQ